MRKPFDISDLVGMIFKSIENHEDEQLKFTSVDGRIFVFEHNQDCCEHVYIESVVGDLDDLVGHPLLMAEESTSREDPPGYEDMLHDESFTWTFYKFATIKGYVDIRWLGESNGYYSESVDLSEISN